MVALPKFAGHRTSVAIAQALDFDFLVLVIVDHTYLVEKDHQNAFAFLHRHTALVADHMVIRQSILVAAFGAEFHTDLRMIHFDSKKQPSRPLALYPSLEKASGLICVQS